MMCRHWNAWCIPRLDQVVTKALGRAAVYACWAFATCVPFLVTFLVHLRHSFLDDNDPKSYLNCLNKQYILKFWIVIKYLYFDFRCGVLFILACLSLYSRPDSFHSRNPALSRKHFGTASLWASKKSLLLHLSATKAFAVHAHAPPVSAS